MKRERNATLSSPLYDRLKNKVLINVGVMRSSSWASTVPELLVAEAGAAWFSARSSARCAISSPNATPRDRSQTGTLRASTTGRRSPIFLFDVTKTYR